TDDHRARRRQIEHFSFKITKKPVQTTAGFFYFGSAEPLDDKTGPNRRIVRFAYQHDLVDRDKKHLGFLVPNADHAADYLYHLAAIYRSVVTGNINRFPVQFL